MNEEKNCITCRHGEKDFEEYPCNKCRDTLPNFTRWEPKPEPNVVDVAKIIALSKKSYSKLIKMNKELERAYTGRRTKVQLIYQIVFKRDA